MSVTLRFQSTGAVPAGSGPVAMRGGSLTIGRGPDNDLVLPDPDRVISKSHCVIEDHGGSIVVLDLSTNGTFLNYGKLPLGRTPTPLNDGDVLSLGAYELVVAMEAQAQTAPPDPAGDRQVSPGDARAAAGTGSALDDFGGDDFLEDLLGSDARPRGPAPWTPDRDRLDGMLPPLSDDDLLGPPPAGDQPAAPDHGPATSDAFSPGGARIAQIPDDWDDLLGPPDPDPSPSAPAPRPSPPRRPAAPPADDLDDLLGPSPTPDAPPAPPAQEEPRAACPAAPEPAAPDPSATSPAGNAAARAYLEALGCSDVPDAELEATMARMGAVTRVMIEGLREVLMTRTSIKSEFRIEQTRIGAGDNNPLKFSVSPDQAVEAMVRPRARGYLPALQAASQALDDIRAHEVGMVTGMEAALAGLLRRLDPAELSARIEDRGGLGRLLKGRKALYWETYEKMYAEVSDQATSDFHEIFSREFADAYRQQLSKLKQGN